MSPQRKIVVTSKSPVGDISVVTLIRTDTTLDHSQTAEKVCKTLGTLYVFNVVVNHCVDSLCASVCLGVAAGAKGRRGVGDCWWQLASLPPLEKYCYG